MFLNDLTVLVKINILKEEINRFPHEHIKHQILLI